MSSESTEGVMSPMPMARVSSKADAALAALGAVVASTPGMGACVAAGLVTVPTLALLAGVVDAIYASAGGVAAFYSAGLYVPLTLALGVGFGLAMGALPWDVGPFGLWGGLKRLAMAQGEEAVRLSSAGWALLGAAAVGFVGMFQLNYIFITAFNHPTLAALTLGVVLCVWAVAVVLGWAILFRALRALLGAAAARGASVVAWPLMPVLLVALVVLTVLVVVPQRYAETWDALDLRAPVMALTLVTTAWAMVGVGARQWRAWAAPRRWVAGAAALAVALVGLLAPTMASFGASPDDADMVAAVQERGLLARVPLGLLQKRFDADKDGYSARLGGGDCDDANAAVFPGAEEVIGNGIDEDCDGKDLVLSADLAAELGGGPAQGIQEEGADTNAEGGAKQQPAAGDKLAGVRKRHNLVLIVVDTLRWDVLGYAGYKRPTSPNLDKLAARAAIFDNAYSSSSKTPTAVPSMLASRWPSEMPRSYNHFIIYDQENLFMAEALKQEGYRTAASAAHWYFQRKYGFAQGFDRWKTYMVKGDEMERIATSKQVTDNAIDMLKGLQGGGLPADGEAAAQPAEGEPSPWFMYVHYLDPHKHYIDHKGFEPFGRGGRDRYDGEVRFTDHHIGRLIAALEEADPGLKNTVIAFTSDHGEAFGEHEHRFHGRDLYEHQIRVPLFIYVPEGKAHRVPARVSLIDLAPTLLDALSVKAPESFRGQSLLSTVALGEPPSPRIIYTEMPPGPYNGVFRSVTRGDWKLIHRLHGNYYRLYNLKDDPGELKDQFKKNPEKANEMQSVYQLFRARNIEPVDAVKR